MIVGSFYTKDYAAEAETLRKSLVQFHIPYRIHKEEGGRNWVHNCNLRPKVILEMLDEIGDRPLLFMDADCVVVRDLQPLVNSLDCDFAVVFQHSMSSSVLYLRKTDLMREMLQSWAKRCEDYPHTLDCVSLQRAWSDMPVKPRTEFLNPAIWLADTEKRDPTEQFLIDHTRVSRRRDAMNHLMWSNNLEKLVGSLAGAHIVVAGLGPSARAMENNHHLYWTVGVNDIGRYWHPDFLVVVDSERSFRKQARWHYIENTKAGLIVYNQDCPLLSLPHPCKAPVQITFPPRTGNDIKIDSIRSLPCWKTSTLSAAVFAYQMGASKIGIIGCDISEDHTTYKSLSQIETWYTELRRKLEEAGVEIYNLSPSSNLEALEYTTLKSFNTKQQFTEDLVRTIAAEGEVLNAQQGISNPS